MDPVEPHDQRVFRRGGRRRRVVGVPESELSDAFTQHTIYWSLITVHMLIQVLGFSPLQSDALYAACSVLALINDTRSPADCNGTP